MAQLPINTTDIRYKTALVTANIDKLDNSNRSSTERNITQLLWRRQILFKDIALPAE